MSIVPPALAHVNPHAALIESFQAVLDHLEGSLWRCPMLTRRWHELAATRSHLLRELAQAEADNEDATQAVGFRETARGVTVLCRDGQEVDLPGRVAADMIAAGLERLGF